MAIYTTNGKYSDSALFMSVESTKLIQDVISIKNTLVTVPSGSMCLDSLAVFESLNCIDPHAVMVLGAMKGSRFVGISPWPGGEWEKAYVVL